MPRAPARSRHDRRHCLLDNGGESPDHGTACAWSVPGGARKEVGRFLVTKSPSSPYRFTIAKTRSRAHPAGLWAVNATRSIRAGTRQRVNSSSVTNDAHIDRVSNDAPNSVTTSGYVRATECFINRPGGDYSNFAITNFDDCHQACGHDQRCKAFTARSISSPPAWC